MEHRPTLSGHFGQRLNATEQHFEYSFTRYRAKNKNKEEIRQSISQLENFHKKHQKG